MDSRVLPANEQRETSRRGWIGVIALALSLACASAAAEDLKIGGTGAALGSMELLAAAFTSRNPEVRFRTVPSLGSGGSIKAVLAGAIDLAVTSRPLSEAERKQGAVETEYARTPFVFVVSTKSRVSAISGAELVDIYAGKKTTWPDGSTVRVLLRPESDIDTAMIKDISAEMRQAYALAEARPGVHFSVNDQDAADDLENIPGAIGASSLALIRSENRALRALKLDGVEPTVKNTAAGAYPHFKRLYFVTGAKRSKTIERFIAFVHSAAGRKILEANGQWIP